MASPHVRFHSLMMFEAQRYRYYRERVRRSAWSPRQLVAATGLFRHFLALSSGQAFSEIASLVRGFSDVSIKKGNLT